MLLADIGSTFTKVCAVDTAKSELLGSAAAPTTVETDVNEGLSAALELLFAKTGALDFAERYACSSAAGGLRMAASGLVPELTAEAARLACLGAGAKLVKLYSYELTAEDVKEIDAIAPDIFLLTGGTDGGNSACIVHNAGMLAASRGSFPILLAGNRSCAAECERLLAGREVYRCDNVMPRFGEIAVSGVQERIRELFLKRIIQAKGLTRVEVLLDGILMPTPSAVLKATELLSSDIGELLAVDLGGATTDVFSMARGTPENDSTILKGLPEPYAKRTVEGDLGMRHCAEGVLEAVGIAEISRLSGLEGERVAALARRAVSEPDFVPQDGEERAFDLALSIAAVGTAVRRHAGRLEQAYTPLGAVFVQTGKSLRGVKTLILTGGAAIHSPDAALLAGSALAGEALSLLPKSLEVLIDSGYTLSATGLLAERYPECALAIMKKELRRYGTAKQTH